jgi:hypothetical protein
MAKPVPETRDMVHRLVKRQSRRERLECVYGVVGSLLVSLCWWPSSPPCFRVEASNCGVSGDSFFPSQREDEYSSP